MIDTQQFPIDIFNDLYHCRWPVEEDYNEDATLKKHRYQINFTQAFSKSKGVIALLFNETTMRTRRLIADLQEIFKRTLEPIRPGRKYPRNHKARPRKFFPQYKPGG